MNRRRKQRINDKRRVQKHRTRFKKLLRSLSWFSTVAYKFDLTDGRWFSERDLAELLKNVEGFHEIDLDRCGLGSRVWYGKR